MSFNVTPRTQAIRNLEATNGLRKFRSQPLNRLNLEFEDFQNRMMQVAFSSPSDYYAIRRTVMNKVLNDTIVDLHTKVYNVLYYGVDGDNQPLLAGLTLNGDQTQEVLGSSGQNFQPRLSEQVADEIAMDFCAGVQDLLREKVVEKILPTNVFNEAMNRSAKKVAVEGLVE